MNNHFYNKAGPVIEINKVPTNKVAALVPKKEEVTKVTAEQEATTTSPEQSTPITTTTTTIQPALPQVRLDKSNQALANQQGVIEITPADSVPTPVTVIDNSKEALMKESLASHVPTTLKPTTVGQEHITRNPKTFFQKADEFIEKNLFNFRKLLD